MVPPEGRRDCLWRSAAFFHFVTIAPASPLARTTDRTMTTLSTPELALTSLLALVSIVWLFLTIATLLGLRSMREDLENNFRSVLRASLSKLDLVTRDEFEVQEAVLQRTREKLEALEARLEAADKKDS